MTKKTFLLFLIITCLGILILPEISFATTTAATTKLANPLGITNIPELIGRIIKAALGIVGSIALLMFIYGGFTLLTSSGNDKMVQKGKNIIVWATIGLVVIFVSYVAVDFVINSLSPVTEEDVEDKSLKQLPENLLEYCEDHSDDPICIGVTGGYDSGPEPEVQCFYSTVCRCETVLTTECMGEVIREGPCPPVGRCAETGGGPLRYRCCCESGELTASSEVSCDLYNITDPGVDCRWLHVSDCPISI